MARLPTTYTGAVRAFITAHPELTATDTPALVQLKALAKELDADPSQGALQSQFGLVYRNLVKRVDAMANPVTTDPLEAELAALEKR